jgi:hypothetical protein
MNLLHIALGYFISAFAGHVIVAWVVNSLWRIADGTKDHDMPLRKRLWHVVTELWRTDVTKDSLRPAPLIRSWHGVTERLIYTSTILAWKARRHCGLARFQGSHANQSQRKRNKTCCWFQHLHDRNSPKRGDWHTRSVLCKVEVFFLKERFI